MECEMPSINSNDHEVKGILEEYKNIAIVGLSPNPEKDSNRVAKVLQKAGYKIFPVYPKEDTILGEKVYRSLTDIPERVDMVNMFRKAEFASTLLEDIKKRDDVKCFWLQLGIINNEVGEACKEMGIQFVQNKCTKLEYLDLVAQ
jgi:predicted CoA-binding protein